MDYRSSKKFLKATLKDYFFLDLETGRFNKVPEYPEEAWLEGIVNALCHRSYYDTRECHLYQTF